jgi:hypothetical protein
LKAIELVTLVVLTFTVLAYNIHFFYGIPSEMYMQAHKWAEGRFPSDLNYTDLQNHPLKNDIMKYVNASILANTWLKVYDIWPIRNWLQSVYDSSWLHEIHLKRESNYYMVDVWYQKAHYPTFWEQTVIWSINVAALSLWILFFGTLPKLIKKNSENLEIRKLEFMKCKKILLEELDSYIVLS